MQHRQVGESGRWLNDWWNIATREANGFLCKKGEPKGLSLIGESAPVRFARVTRGYAYPHGAFDKYAVAGW